MKKTMLSLLCILACVTSTIQYAQIQQLTKKEIFVAALKNYSGNLINTTKQTLSNNKKLIFISTGIAVGATGLSLYFNSEKNSKYLPEALFGTQKSFNPLTSHLAHNVSKNLKLFFWNITNAVKIFCGKQPIKIAIGISDKDFSNEKTEIENLTTQLDTAKKENEKLTTNLNIFKDQNAELLKKEVIYLENTTQLNKNIDELNTNITSLRNELTLANNTIDLRDEKIKDKENQREEQQKSYFALETKYNELQTQFNTLTNNLNNLQTTLTSTEQNYNTLDKKHQGLIKEHMDLQTKYDELTKEYEEFKTQHDTINKI